MQTFDLHTARAGQHDYSCPNHGTEECDCQMDEAFKAFIMPGSAMIYAGVLLGPWGAFKDAAYHVGSGAWFIYAVIFLALIFVVLPSLFAFCILPFDNINAFKKRFAALSNALIPLGLMFWVAFSLSFVLTNASYILAALSDPLGLGWNLFGIANIAWQPIYQLPITRLLPLAFTLSDIRRFIQYLPDGIPTLGRGRLSLAIQRNPRSPRQRKTTLRPKLRRLSRREWRGGWRLCRRTAPLSQWERGWRRGRSNDAVAR